MAPLRIGVIGLSTQGWASSAHVTAFDQLKDTIKLTALSTRRAESAKEAAEKYDVKGYHGDPAQIAQDPNVDLVVVSVAAPYHKEAVWPAIEAGKDVFVEWPLGKNLAEAREIADFAKSKQVKTMIGLQARWSPAVRRIKELVEAGEIGTIQSTTLIGAGGGWGAEVDGGALYNQDASQGVTLLSIALLHTLDGISTVLGEFSSLSAVLSIVNASPKIKGTEETTTRTAPDHVLISGTLKSGAVASVHYKGGMEYAKQGGHDFYWEVLGSKGTITAKGWLGHLQLAEPSVFLNGEAVDVASDPLSNIAHNYKAFAEGDTSGYLDFEHAVKRHELIEAIERSAREGVRVNL